MIVQNASVWLIIVAALVAANLPFLNERWLLVGPTADHQSKPFWVRLLELCVLYILLGLFAFVLEQRVGQVHAQGWEFYAITITLFLTLAFPGFVYRYLTKRSR